jgi:hypothetical protein
VNIKVHIELEGNTAEVEAWLARFGSLTGTDGMATRAESADTDGEWTPELADRLIERITEKARMALWHIAANAPEISFEELQKEMRMGGISIGGVLASFGFAKNAGLPRPFRVDRERRRYIVEPRVAEIMIDAIRRYEGDEDY